MTKSECHYLQKGLQKSETAVVVDLLFMNLLSSFML